MQNFRKLAELKIPKNRGELYNNVNIAKSKNWKSVEIREIFRNSKKQKYGSREGYCEPACKISLESKHGKIV